MLNKNNERELAYVVIVDGIEELPGYDRVESAIIGGWHCIVPKGQFHIGDPGIYFEIDSCVPSDNPAFAFLEKRNYKIKTQKMCKSISQGLLMHAEDFGWHIIEERDGIVDNNDKFHYADDESRFLTKELGVTYADAEDNIRKAPSIDKYKRMAQRHPKVFSTTWARWFMRRQWGKDLMFLFFGNNKYKKNNWPAWVKKTDEERIENMPWILKNKSEEWIATEKIDGSSATFTMYRGKFGKKEFYVCSRNVCFNKEEENIYWEMAKKYNLFEVLSDILKHMPEAKWATIQGEVYGAGVQKNTYDLVGHDLAVFNLITSNKGRWNSCAMKNLLEYTYNIPCVPIISTNFKMPDTVEELRSFVNHAPSRINFEMREGIVFRSIDGQKSFKCVSPEYLLKYHG